MIRKWPVEYNQELQPKPKSLCYAEAYLSDFFFKTSFIAGFVLKWFIKRWLSIWWIIGQFFQAETFKRWEIAVQNYLPAVFTAKINFH